MRYQTMNICAHVSKSLWKLSLSVEGLVDRDELEIAKEYLLLWSNGTSSRGAFFQGWIIPQSSPVSVEESARNWGIKQQVINAR